MEEPAKVAEEPTEPTEPVEPTEPSEPTEPAEEPTEPVEPGEPGEPTEPTEPVKPHKQTAQERINELTRLRREAEREAEYWKKLAVKPEEVKEKPSVVGDRPRQENYNTIEEYEDALFDWRDQKRTVAIEQESRQKKQIEALKTFNENAAELRKAHEDFDEVVETPVFTDIMREVIFSAETGPELAYYLGKNRDVAKKIAQLPPAVQPYELGKLETQIKLAQKTKTVTGAPPPIKPIGSETGGGKKDPSKMTTDEWMEWRKEADLEKIKAKYSAV